MAEFKEFDQEDWEGLSADYSGDDRSDSSDAYFSALDADYVASVARRKQIWSKVVDYTFRPVTFDDVIGHKEVGQRLREMVSVHAEMPELAQAAGLAVSGGTILHGVPGSGKSLLFHALANWTVSRYGSNKYVIGTMDPSTIASTWQSGSELSSVAVVEVMADLAPCIILLDEV